MLMVLTKGSRNSTNHSWVCRLSRRWLQRCWDVKIVFCGVGVPFYSVTGGHGGASTGSSCGGTRRAPVRDCLGGGDVGGGGIGREVLGGGGSSGGGDGLLPRRFVWRSRRAQVGLGRFGLRSSDGQDSHNSHVLGPETERWFHAGQAAFGARESHQLPLGQ
ncbi:uncharacterized protein PG986_000387 [Apiospora aurea]|uniref:Uncharacterized protein n=1 Tax=Apiospora aurea TaxID=335848 RepID=A0ABR1QTX9_9PEZI